MNANWHNVSRREPCPICHKADWCTVSNDGAVCVCRRIESDRPAKSGYGWIHLLRDPKAGATPIRRKPTTPLPASVRPDFARLHASYNGAAELQDGLAFGLGLDGDSFAALDVRYNAANECMSFPMRDAEGDITGLRYRHLTTGRKWSAKGSKDGLFFSADNPVRSPDEIVVTEGPTDTAAALSLGLDAVGRSSCLAGTELLRGFIRARRIRRVTIFADGDKPGIEGARRLSASLPVLSRIVLPPPAIKDLREWYRKGLRPAQFRNAASAAPWRCGAR